MTTCHITEFSMRTPSSKKKPYVVKRSFAGLGLFATAPIVKGAWVIEYTGRKITHAAADHKGGKYLFTLNEEWIVDGTGRENTARYLNHSCTPTCEAIIEQWPRGDRIMIYALRDIAPGEELTYDYGAEYFDAHIGAHCRCAHCHRKSI